MTSPSKKEKVRELAFEKGLKPREIAVLLGMSTQGVYKHLAALKAESEAKKASA